MYTVLAAGWRKNIDFALNLPCLGSITRPAMPVRRFGKGNSQDLFDFLLFPAFICQIASGPEDQQPERWEE